MSASYRAIGWNAQKRAYDAALAAGVLAYLAAFALVALRAHPQATAETLLLRASGTAAFALLHLVLCIGPLCRLDARCLPLLYNRRHLGVTTFALGALHGLLALVQFHSQGVLDPLVSALSSEGVLGSAPATPFHLFGLGALAILFLLAATSHDFWLANLSAPVWKALHMLVYLAYALLVAHVGFGAARAGGGGVLLACTALGAALVCSLHLAAALRERRADRASQRSAHVTEPQSVNAQEAEAVNWIDAGTPDQIELGRARTVLVAGERVAVFRHERGLSAVSAVCQHQNGPLGEGRVLDGCIVCPWHGYQYVPETGCSPPPFTERIPSFRVRLAQGRVQVATRPLPLGTHSEPLPVGGAEGA
jgi:sulfoxide reductase heme-binding subunit YedZ